MSRDEAVKAAAEALRTSNGRFRCEFHRAPESSCDTCLADAEDALFDARIAVDAVWPVIERAVRAQAAAEVRAGCWHKPPGATWTCDPCSEAARIVEGP